ncbi:hypothetical protein PanWU01x14_075330, partial [Parasponia andersonii]
MAIARSEFSEAGVAIVVALQERVTTVLMDTSIMDNKATRRKLAPTANKNLYCLKKDYGELR